MTFEVDRPPGGTARNREPPSGREQVGRALVIGLINNMPDSAVDGTENQFNALLTAASASVGVRLRYSTLPEVPRSAVVAARIADRYWKLEDLYRDPPDALIVTGTEPRAALLTDEPYWTRLVQLIEFAQTRVRSSVWSCLAAHAAVEHLDGISRRRLPTKRSGVYRHEVTLGHPLTANVGASLQTPHSRWNDLPLEALTGAGYDRQSRT